MDYRLPVAKRTRSREAHMYRECYENIKKKKLDIGGFESMSQNASNFKEDESVKLHAKSTGSRSKNVGVDCLVDSAVLDACEEESANVGKKDKGKSIFSERANVRGKDKGKSIVSDSMDSTIPITIDSSDDDDDDVVYIGKKDDLSVEEYENVVCIDDEEDVLGESSSFYSNNMDENEGLNSDGEKISGVSSHEVSSDVDYDLEEYSGELKVFSSEEDIDDEDFVVEKFNSTGIVSEEEEENYVGESEFMKRGSDEGGNLRRVENLSSSSFHDKGNDEDGDQIEDTERSEELNTFIDSDNAKDNEIDKNGSVNVGGELTCVAKRTRSHVLLESKKKKEELGTAGYPFSVDEDTDSLNDRGDDDYDDSDDSETQQRVCKTGAKKSAIRPGRGNGDKLLHALSKQDKGKFIKSKIKRKSMMKDQDVEEILLNSIWDSEEIPLEDPLFSKSEVLIEERSQLDDETFLPLKFNFGNEESTPSEKSEFQKDLDSLWTEMDFAFAASAIGSTDSSMDKNEAEPSPEVEHDQATCCSQGKHQLILDEEIGIICKFCSFVQLEIKYIVPSFAKNSRERYRRDSKIEDDSVLGELHFQDSGFDSQFCLDPCSRAEGTVWDLVPGVKNSMYRHQREGFEFIWRNIAGGIDLDKLKPSTTSGGGNGCIISHAPGTGKTRLAIVFLQAYMKMYPTCRPVIIAPCNMLLTWEEEFKKWKTGITFHNLNNPVLSGSELLDIQNPPESLVRTLKLWSWNRGGGVLGISYTRFKILVGVMKNSEKKSRELDEQTRKILLELPGLFVFDEGHIPRNDQTDIFKALLEIQTEKRIILSGTPFQNNFEELFNTFYLVRPKFVNGMRSRNQRDSVPKRGRKRKGEKGKWATLTSSIGKAADDRLADEKKLNELRTIIEPFVHVYKGTVLQDSLPGLRHSVVVLRPFDLQKKLLEGVQGKSDIIKQNFLVSLISAHPSLVLDRTCEKEVFIDNRAELERIRLNPEAGIKTKFLMKLLRLSEALNEKVLVFSQYLVPLILIKDQLEDSFNWIEGREVLFMHGKQDPRVRQSSINIFNDPLSEVKVLLASTKACGEGINLVGASRVVLLDVAWNPSVDRQAISRAYRLGQKKFVHVYHLITSGTMEEKKCYRQAKKDWLSNSVFFSFDRKGNGRKISSKTMDDKILEEMVQHDKENYIENVIEENDESTLMDALGLLGDR